MIMYSVCFYNFVNEKMCACKIEYTALKIEYKLERRKPNENKTNEIHKFLHSILVRIKAVIKTFIEKKISDTLIKTVTLHYKTNFLISNVFLHACTHICGKVT